MQTFYVLNPGDMQDVQTFDEARVAVSMFQQADASPFARLYRCTTSLRRAPAQQWESYERGRWFEANRDDIPLKVLDARKSR